MTTGDERSQVLLEVTDLSHWLQLDRGPLHVLDDISFDVRRGEFISVIGPSGCGKSTLFNILAGLDTPSYGDIRADGRSIVNDTSMCAYMPQKDLLFPWRNIVDNAALGLQVQGVDKQTRRATVNDLLPTFGLDGFQNAYPFELSGGMRQRVALLRTVIQGRPVLLLDEPFGPLDYLTRVDLQLWLSEMWQQEGWTVVLITHDVPEAIFLSDRVVALSERPAHAELILEIDLPRPRDLNVHRLPQFGEYEGILLAHFRESNSASPGASVLG